MEAIHAFKRRVGAIKCMLSKKIISILGFATIFFLLLFEMQDILLPDWPEETIKYTTYKKLEENVLDVLFLGNSHQYYSIYPLEIYSKYQIRSFNLGSPQETIIQSYYQLKEAYKTQKIKYCFLDVSSLFHLDKVSEFSHNERYKMMVCMNTSINKLMLIDEYTSSAQDKLELFLPIYKFHSRWNQLSESDFNLDKKQWDEYKIRYGAYFATNISPFLGYRQYYDEPLIFSENINDDVNEYYNSEERPIDGVLNQNEVDYFLKVNEFCKENGINLIAIYAPSVTSWSSKQHDEMLKLVKENDVELIDMMCDPYKIDIDWSRETPDGGLHCNFLGGLKVSEFIGKWIIENCPDLRINDNFSTREQWEKDLNTYLKIKGEIYNSMKTNDEKIDDIFQYIKSNIDDMVLIISVRNDFATFWNEDLDNNMHSLGLKEEYYGKRQYSYIAVIDEGKIEFEKASPKSIVYMMSFKNEGDHNLYVRSENFQQGNTCSIQIDRIEYALDEQGMNFVVYNIGKDEVVSCFNINTTSPLLELTMKSCDSSD